MLSIQNAEEMQSFWMKNTETFNCKLLTTPVLYIFFQPLILFP